MIDRCREAVNIREKERMKSRKSEKVCEYKREGKKENRERGCE